MIINSKTKLKNTIELAKKSGKSVLIKKGVFDIIHPGHIFAIKMFDKEADIVSVPDYCIKPVREEPGDWGEPPLKVFKIPIHYLKLRKTRKRNKK